MTETIPPVRHSVVVGTDPETAFDVYTGAAGNWWPKEHSIGSEPLADVVMEHHEGGRVYEVGVDGAECDWGRVLAWEPPTRLVVSWQINHVWQYEPDAGKCSEYEVRFEPVAEGSTRVTIEHRNFERHGEGGPGIRAAVDAPDGWPATLQLFEQQVTASVL